MRWIVAQRTGYGLDARVITGTIKYTASDLIEADRVFQADHAMPLWRACFAVSVMGAIIGYGFTVIAQSTFSDSAQNIWAAWGALSGSIALVTIGAWRSSKRQSPQFEAAVNQVQRFAVSDAGVVLETEDVTTSMKWTYFTDCRQTQGRIILRTKDQTVVVFSRELFQIAGEWERLEAFVKAELPGRLEVSAHISRS